MNIRQPIFIIGSGRSGTSLVYRLLATHPDLCWFSNLSDQYESLPLAILANRFADFSLVKQAIVDGKAFALLPSEGGNIYHKLCHFAYQKKTTERDLGSVNARLFFRIIDNHLRLSGKSRFLNKQTANTQRLRLMHQLFPDAYWIHMIRDGRAVAYSLSQVDWWPSVQLWWHKGDRPAQLARPNSDPLLLCAEHWKRNVSEIQSCRLLFGKRYREVHYEDLVRRPREVVGDVLRWCGLSSPSAYLRLLPETLPNRNNRWRRELPAKEKVALTKHLSSMLKLFHYEL